MGVEFLSALGEQDRDENDEDEDEKEEGGFDVRIHAFGIRHFFLFDTYCSG